MEDRRILKTKQKLKTALMELLQTKTFDEMTVTELCQKAKMSRITFYTHYQDKYDLLEAMLQELFEEASQDFDHLQAANNQEGDPKKTYSNMLDCILNLFATYQGFLSQASQRKNPYLYYSFYQRIFHRVFDCIEAEREKAQLSPRFEIAKFASFICTGLWSYITECMHEQDDVNQIRRETHTLLGGILDSEIFGTYQEK